MCGIAGIVGGSDAHRADRMRAMREQLVHRGPDSGGEHVDDRAALGIRRLRVIDLVTGDQPMSNEDGRITTVFNGEIYNYRELRDSLISRGHSLRTLSDTEVIPHLYEDHGPAFVSRLAGMFALALWDRGEGTLVLARDRLGKKPLLYRDADGSLAFASEHSALLQGPGSRPSVDPRAIRAYLRLGYVPAPFDAFEGVRKLPPAHYLVWRDGEVVVSRYWSIPTDEVAIDEPDALTEFRRLFDRAVSRRLISDVPLGALLSGGVDSSAVVATMARHSAQVRTFSIGFEETGFSELPHARRVAERFGTEHHEFVVRPDAMEILPELVRHYGEPYADSSALPTYYLAKLTRQHVTVALDGDGGDELFAGYERYRAAQVAERLDVVPAGVRRAIAGVAARTIPDSISPGDPLRRLRRFIEVTPASPRQRYLHWLSVFDDTQLEDLLTPGFAEASRSDTVESLVELDHGRDVASAAQIVDLGLYLPDDLLVKMDIASMANSLEVRCPFLDHELVEFAVRLPTGLKIRGGERKYLLKKAFEGIIPRENMYRTKQGFALPVGVWFRGDLGAYIRELVLAPESLARGYFRPDRLQGLVEDHVSGRVDHTHRLWALLMLEQWHREMGA